MPELRPLDDLPLTVLVPASAPRPIVMYDPQGALRLAVVEHDSASALGDSWDSAGVYVLLWPPVDEADRQPKVYVGQAAQPARRREAGLAPGRARRSRECQVRLQLGPDRLARGSALAFDLGSRACAAHEQGAAQ